MILIKRITPEEANQYISTKDDLLGYPSRFFTLTPCTIPGWENWEDVTYYTDRKKIISKPEREGKYWVYVLSNISMPGLLKVGYTKLQPGIRAHQVSSVTGVATPFNVEYSFKCHEGEFLEAEVHKCLEPYRVSNNREFFNVGLDKVVKIIEEFGEKYI